MAGTVTLASVVLAVTVSPWFLLLTAFVGLSQWAYVATGACPASLVLQRVHPPEGVRTMSALGPIGRLGRWSATHVRLVVVAWAIVVIALGVLAPRVETALSGRRLGGLGLAVGPGP